ncbi:hypothetical protein Cgig2_015072 [Carnegiea gigantea]|uniref:Uncharacterized protein n=1 Tax=Carnegiea gigantea TaxID=171969 RepID=A0A9Q1GNE3_9CARY|nr:hypothetical protein Cgig2_015072 [Carnegiea gigantea]
MTRQQEAASPLPPTLGIGRHLFRSGVPSLKDDQPHPQLICIKQIGSQTAIHLVGSSFTRASASGITKEYSAGTESPGPSDASGEEELVEGPSKDELLEEWPEEEPDEPSAEDGAILAAGIRGSARLKKGNGIRNLFRLPTLIPSGDSNHHPAINKGWEVGELRALTLHLGASWPLRDTPTSSGGQYSCTPLITSSMQFSQTSKVDHLKPTSDDFILSAMYSRTTPSSNASFSSIEKIGAQTQLPRPRPWPTKSTGIVCGNLQEAGEADARCSSNAR